MSRSKHLCRFLLAWLMLAGALIAGELDESYSITCRRGYIAEFENEYLIALNYVPALTNRRDRMVVFVTKRGNGYYLHSNFQSRVPELFEDEIKKVVEKSQDGEKLSETEQKLLKMLKTDFFREAGHWYFKHPTKIATTGIDPFWEKVVRLVFPTEHAISDDETKAFAKSFVCDINFILERSVESLDVKPAQRVRVVDVDRSRVGVIYDRASIPGHGKDRKEAANAIGELTTSRFEEGVVYIKKRSDGRLYLQSNFRPKLPDGTIAPFPAKLVTPFEDDLLLLTSVLFFNHDVPVVAPGKPAPEPFLQFLNAYLNNVRFIVSPSLRSELQFKGASRIELIQ